MIGYADLPVLESVFLQDALYSDGLLATSSTWSSVSKLGKQAVVQTKTGGPRQSENDTGKKETNYGEITDECRAHY